MRKLRYILAGVIIYAVCRLLLNQQELLYAAQDRLILRSDWHFFSNLLHQPYALLDYASRWLTAGFYVPVFGVTILSGLWILSAIFTNIALKPAKEFKWLIILPVFCLLVSITQMGYWIYFLKYSGYWFFFSVLWCWWSVLLLIVFRIKSTIIRIISLMIWGAFLTPWNGWKIQLFSTSETDYVLQPIYLLAFILVLQIIVKFAESKLLLFFQKKHLWFFCALLFLGGGVCWSSMLDYTSDRFVAELKANRLAEKGDWNRILHLSDKLKRQPTRQFVLMRDAALLHTDRLLQEEPSTDNLELQKQISMSNQCMGTIPKMRNMPQVFMAFSGAPLLYFCYGYVNDAYRWAYEYGIENGMTAQRIRLLLNCSLINEEWDLCRRYIRLLRLMPHQSDVADEAEFLVENPVQILSHPLLGPVKKIKQQNNKLNFGNSYIENVLFSDPDSPIYAHRKWHFMGQTKVSTY